MDGGSDTTGKVLQKAASPEAGMRLSAELQITYATGVVAGTAMAAYYAIDHGREAGYGSIEEGALAVLLAALLELVSVGMILHIMYRGFWIAMRLLVETRTDQGLATPDQVALWEQEIHDLDGACQALFFRTFRILYAGMVWIGLGFSMSLAASETPPFDWIGLGLVLLLLPAIVPEMPTIRRFGPPGRALAWIGRKLTALRRRLGFWWLSADPSPIGLAGWVLLAFGGVALYFVNWGWMMDCELAADRTVYYQNRGDMVELTMRVGGFRIPEEAHPRVTVTARGRAASVELTMHQVKGNRFLAAVESSRLPTGPVNVEALFDMEYGSQGSKLQVHGLQAETSLLVLP